MHKFPFWNIFPKQQRVLTCAGEGVKKTEGFCKKARENFGQRTEIRIFRPMKQKKAEYGFADVMLSRRRKEDLFFKRVAKQVDWSELRQALEQVYVKGQRRSGRRSYDALLLFKIELLRRWYGLSDSEAELEVNDRLSFSRFVGLSMDGVCPDSTTICRFRKTLERGGVYEPLIEKVGTALANAGYTLQRGIIMRASLTKRKAPTKASTK